MKTCGKKKKIRRNTYFDLWNPVGTFFQEVLCACVKLCGKIFYQGRKKCAWNQVIFFVSYMKKKQTFFSWKCFFCVRFHTWEHYFSLNFFFSLVFTDIKEKHVLTSPSKSFFFFHHQFSSHTAVKTLQIRLRKWITRKKQNPHLSFCKTILDNLGVEISPSAANNPHFL